MRQSVEILITSVNEEPKETLGSDVKVGTSDVPTSYANAAKLSAEEKKRGIDAGSVPNPKAKKTGTKGLGIELNAAALGAGGSVGLSVHEDAKGDYAVATEFSYGADSNMGLSVEASYEQTNAKDVSQLKGTSLEIESSYNIGGPGVAPGIGIGGGHTEAPGYTGKKANVSIGWGLSKPINANAKRTHTWTWSPF